MKRITAIILIFVLSFSSVLPTKAITVTESNDFWHESLEILDEFSFLGDDGDTVSLLGVIDNVTVIAGGGVFIGSGITTVVGRNRVNRGLDTWSVTQEDARGLIVGAATVPEISGRYQTAGNSGQWFFWHMHPNPRNGSHVMFGLPFPAGHGQV